MTDRRADWERDRLKPALERAPERKPSFSTISDMPIERLYGPWSLAEDAEERIGMPGRAAVHPRHPPDRLPEPPLDHAHVRRLRLGGGHE